MPLVLAALYWQASPQQPPLEQFEAAVGTLERIGWGGRLRYTSALGSWHEHRYGPQRPDVPVQPMTPRQPKPPRPSPARPLGTAVSVLPLRDVEGQSPASYRARAAECEAEAHVLDKQAAQLEAEGVARPTRRSQADVDSRRALAQRLFEFAAGQEGEAYAAEGEIQSKQQEQAQSRPKTVNQQQRDLPSHVAGLQPWQGSHQHAPSMATTHRQPAAPVPYQRAYAPSLPQQQRVQMMPPAVGASSAFRNGPLMPVFR